MAPPGTADLRLSEIAPGVHELRLPIPWEDEFVNCFLFTQGKNVDLVDCGIQDDDSVGMILAALEAVAGPGAKLRRLVITHIHPDHFGAAGGLQERTGAQLYMHRLEVPMVHPRYLELEQLVKDVGDHLRVNGVPESDIGTMQNASRAMRNFVRPGEPNVQLDGAETLTLGERRLRVEWTPGHSPGHICLFDVDSKLLFAGDQLLPDISPNIALHPQSTPNPLGEFLDSLDHLLALGPARVMPAHGRPFTTAAERVARLRAHHERRLDQIAALVGTRTMTAHEVAIRTWGERHEHWERRMALQEGLAHLQLLAVQGRIIKLADPDGVRWQGLD